MFVNITICSAARRESRQRMIEGTYEYACAQLIHWIEGTGEGWLEKQAPALREVYAQAKMAQQRAVEHSVERSRPERGSWRNARGVLSEIREGE